MSTRTIALAFSPLLIGFTLLVAVPANGQQVGAKPDDAEVLTRGAIHEAYADPGVTPTEAPPIVPKQPPEPINELPPDQKPEGDNVVWMPGYFAWDEEREDFVWLSGFWRTPPPGRTWMPGSWRQVRDGWQWTSGFWADAAQDNVQYLPPPPEPLEAAPSTPAPSEDSIFTPGTWVYRDARYLWRPGVWITYRPGWIWVPAHYVWTPVGWVFVDGYYDFPPRQRGLLFAPVYFAGRPWLRPGWYYTPSYAVYDDFLTGALFLRPRCGGYWFGDYFGPTYARRGFLPWIDIRFGRGVYDPLFSFYLRSNRGDRFWDRDVRALYASRFNGDNLPPRTLAQQTTIINNNKNITNIKNVTVVAPLTKIDPAVVKLRPVPREQLVQERKAIERFRDVGVQRNKLETQLLAKGPAPLKVTDAPRTLKLDLPPATKPLTTVKPPPPPTSAPLVTKPKDAKPLNLLQGKDVGAKPPVVTPKKDAPPPPPVKKDAPPPQKKDAPPAQKKDAPPMQKKDKDKDKDKKQAVLSAPIQRQQSSPPLSASRASTTAASRPEAKIVAPVPHQVTAAPPARNEAKNSPPARHEAKAPAPALRDGKGPDTRRQEARVSAPERQKSPLATTHATAQTAAQESKGRTPKEKSKEKN